MNAKLIRTAVLSALLLAASAVSLAATGAGNSNAGASPQSREHGSMMGGMMGSDGMMGGCPMMGGNVGMDPKTAMRMHADMMRAMSDIMLKYSDQVGTTPSK
ncbi:hypothetical protein [Paraburkholderia dilworthii]|uniref:Uncharacterized protein n=1 Tax=Paraburkholderia dilworthii TaxID=948106 RepID=A0ABW9DFW9_9BURK